MKQARVTNPASWLTPITGQSDTAEEKNKVSTRLKDSHFTVKYGSIPIYSSPHWQGRTRPPPLTLTFMNWLHACTFLPCQPYPLHVSPNDSSFETNASWEKKLSHLRLKAGWERCVSLIAYRKRARLTAWNVSAITGSPQRTFRVINRTCSIDARCPLDKWCDSLYSQYYVILFSFGIIGINGIREAHSDSTVCACGNFLREPVGWCFHVFEFAMAAIRS